MLRRSSPLPRGNKPLSATTGLTRKTPLVARDPAAGGEAPSVRDQKRKKRRNTGPDQPTVEAVYERAAWCCEICSDHVGPRRGTDHHLHHRRPRAAGGTHRPDTNSPANLLLLCPTCHTGVESLRAVALANGWLLPQVSDPACCAVLIYRHSHWVYLTADARYSLHPPNESEG